MEMVVKMVSRADQERDEEDDRHEQDDEPTARAHRSSCAVVGAQLLPARVVRAMRSQWQDRPVGDQQQRR